MKQFIFTLFTLSLCISTITAQESFEARVRSISNYIDKVVKEEKETLRKEVAAINAKRDTREISEQEAEQMKIEAAELSASRMENRLAPYREELNELISRKAEGKIKSDNSSTDYDDKPIRIELHRSKKEYNTGERRSTTQFIFAFGLNNAIINGELNSISDSDFRVANSRFYEWGLSGKTRLIKESNLLQLKYGISLIYNNLRPAGNQYFIEQGNKTILAEHPNVLNKNPYFRNTQLVFPLHLEFDFTPKKQVDNRVILRTQRKMRVGLGGYAGFNLRTRQILEYRTSGNEVHESTKGDFNTNSIIYGLGFYVGYKDISLYTKYDLNTLFKNNETDLNNISFGIRFDFN